MEVTGDTLTSDDVIGHTCDNRVCTRNDDEGAYAVNGVLLPRRGHLFKGTIANNVHDMIQKGRGRQVTRVGEHHPRAKLTKATVQQIRSQAAGGVPLPTLAAKHDVTVTLIRLIVKKRIWRHVD